MTLNSIGNLLQMAVTWLCFTGIVIISDETFPREKNEPNRYPTPPLSKALSASPYILVDYGFNDLCPAQAALR